MEERRRLYATLLATLLLAMVSAGAASADPVSTDRQSEIQAWAPWSALIKTLDAVLERVSAAWGDKDAPNLDPDGLRGAQPPVRKEHAPNLDPNGFIEGAPAGAKKHAPLIDPNGLVRAVPPVLDHHAPVIDPHG